MPSDDNDNEIETPEVSSQGDGEAEDEGLEMGEPSESENDD